jgi:phosphate-selective porin OprO/OprP
VTSARRPRRGAVTFSLWAHEIVTDDALMLVFAAVVAVAVAQLEDGGVPEPEPISADAGVHDAGTPHPAAMLRVAYGHGVQFKGENLEVQLRARAQVRASALVPEGVSWSRVNEIMIRRLRVVISAKFLEHFSFYLQLAFAPLDMEADFLSPLRDAYVTWAPLRDVNVRAGQMKVPYGRQRVISSSAQQMVDRSIVVGELNLDRDVGVQLRSDDLLGLKGRLSYQLGIFSGDGRNRLGVNPGLLYVARVQVAPFGGFEDLVEVDFERSPKPRLAVGFAAAHNQDTNRQRSTFQTVFTNGFVSYDHLAADLLFKWRGLSVSLEVLWRKANRDVLPGPTDQYSRLAWGYFAQAGWMFLPWLEVTGRWGDLRPFSGTDPKLVRQTELGAGIGFYPYKHDLKLQADYFWLAGDRLDVGTHQVRVQLQTFF